MKRKKTWLALILISCLFFSACSSYRGNQLVIEALVEIIPDEGHVFPREGSNASVKMTNFLAQ